MTGRGELLRGGITLAVIGGLTAAALTVPVEAAIKKKKVVKIARRQATAIVEAETQGPIEISLGPQAWVSDDVTVGYFNNITSFSDSQQDQYVATTVGAPVTIHGEQAQLVGAELCYRKLPFTPPATLDAVFLNVWRNTTSGQANDPVAQLVDDQDRGGEACRFYRLPSPFPLTGEDFVNLVLRLDFDAGGSSFDVGRTTFVFNGTTTAQALARP